MNKNFIGNAGSKYEDMAEFRTNFMFLFVIEFHVAILVRNYVFVKQKNPQKRIFLASSDIINDG